jgi:hypothetical protein
MSGLGSILGALKHIWLKTSAKASHWVRGTQALQNTTGRAESLNAARTSGAMTIIADIALENWAADDWQVIVARDDATNREFDFFIENYIHRGQIDFGINGGAGLSFAIGPVLGFEPGSRHKLKVVMTRSEGANAITYYKEVDGAWAYLDTVAVLEDVTVDSGVKLTVGAAALGQSPLKGKIYSIQAFDDQGALLFSFVPDDAEIGALEFTSTATGEQWSLVDSAIVQEEESFPAWSKQSSSTDTWS